MACENVTYELTDGVAVITMDDGKANAFGHANIDAIGEFLTRAEQEAGALLIHGREGKFSAGFDMSVMTAGPDAVRGLVTAGAEMLLRLFEYPRPVVAACSGHALAAGALMLLASDRRIGARGSFKLGLNEVAISMTLPIFGVEMGRARLSPRYLTRSITQAEIFDPETAVEAGYLDAVCDAADLAEIAFADAKRLSALPHPAFRNTKKHERRAVVEHIRATLGQDMARIGPSN